MEGQFGDLIISVMRQYLRVPRNDSCNFVFISDGWHFDKTASDSAKGVTCGLDIVTIEQDPTKAIEYSTLEGQVNARQRTPPSGFR